MDQKKIRTVRHRIRRWFDQHQRDLPWRRTRDPYKILVAEVMLQQTQVDRVLPKYAAFLRRFPSLSPLARASVADVIRLWSGLGYNRRAVMLHQCATVVLRDYHGKIPDNIDALEKLPGIGPYTARAITSFAFDRDVAVLDTNHRRLIHRVFLGLEFPKRLKSDTALLKMAEQILPKGHGHQWNQALMDFGAMVCTSRNPKCATCPMQDVCAAYPQIKNASVTLQTFLRKGKGNGERFEGSNRYYRGRIIAILRQSSPLSCQKLASRMAVYHFWDMERLRVLLQDLSAESLLVYDQETETVRLPI